MLTRESRADPCPACGDATCLRDSLEGGDDQRPVVWVCFECMATGVFRDCESEGKSHDWVALSARCGDPPMLVMECKDCNWTAMQEVPSG